MSTTCTSLDYRTIPGAALTDAERELLKSTAEKAEHDFHNPIFVSIGSVGWEAPLCCLRAGAVDVTIIGVVIPNCQDEIPPSYCAAVMLKADSAAYGRIYQEPIHLLFIDGLHYAETVLADLEAWTPHVVAGGYVLLHDYQPSNYDLHFHPDLMGVRDGVRAWYLRNSREWEKVGITDSIIAFRRRETPLDHDQSLELTMTNLPAQVTAITVNYKTRDLTKTAITSLRKFYPDIHYILVDNYSRDDSAMMILGYSKNPLYTVIVNKTNVGHGPAMQQAIAKVTTPFFITFDSDSEMQSEGMIETMLARMATNPKLYALGWLRYVDRFSGVPHEWRLDKPPHGDRFIPYVHPCAGLYRMSMYQQLPSFQHHGAPCLDNMVAAYEKKFATENFPVTSYMKHWEAGTRRLFSGDWDISDNRKPGRWDAKQRFPI